MTIVLGGTFSTFQPAGIVPAVRVEQAAFRVVGSRCSVAAWPLFAGPCATT